MIGGLLLCSGFLYVLDVYATTALDRYLLEHYGPELYERYTSEYDPDGNGLGAARAVTERFVRRGFEFGG